MLTFLFFGALFALLAAAGSGRASHLRALRAADERDRSERRELGTSLPREHEYVRVDAGSFAHLDLAYYDRAAAELAKHGFRTVADIEDLTLSRTYPGLRTFIRAMVDDAGIIRAGVYHVRRGGLAILALGIVPRNVRIIELVTEAPQGRFLSTSTSRGLDHALPPPEVEIERLPVDSDIHALVTRHHERVAARLGRGNRTPVVITSYDGLISSVQRGNAVIARFRDGSQAGDGATDSTR